MVSLTHFLSHISRSHTAIHRDGATGGAAGAGAGQEADGLGHVLGVDVHFQGGALAVKFIQFFGLDTIPGGAGLAPTTVPDAAALQHRIGQDAIDADAGGAALFGQAARQVQLGSLGGAIGGGVLARGYAVLTSDEDQAAAHLLRFPQAEGFAANQEVAFGQHIHSEQSLRLVCSTGALRAIPAQLTTISTPP